VVDNLRHVLAIEMMTACQALEFLRPLKTSPALEQVRADLARLTPPRKDDRPFSADIARVAEWLKEWNE